ncbi:MAG: hypothetical protein NC253_13005 [Ruminococcus sp.]|nr:hypothetical protein [Ruminococcus sp.]
MILNKQLLSKEEKWLNCILSVDTKYKDVIISQIMHSQIIREYTNYYISLKFEVNKEKVCRLDVKRGVIIEMRLFKLHQAPIQFLLHAVHGYVSEFEIFHSDSTYLSSDIIINDNDFIEIIPNI